MSMSKDMPMSATASASTVSGRMSLVCSDHQRSRRRMPGTLSTTSKEESSIPSPSSSPQRAISVSDWGCSRLWVQVFQPLEKAISVGSFTFSTSSIYSSQFGIEH